MYPYQNQQMSYGQSPLQPQYQAPQQQRQPSAAEQLLAYLQQGQQNQQAKPMAGSVQQQQQPQKSGGGTMPQSAPSKLRQEGIARTQSAAGQNPGFSQGGFGF